MSKSTINFGEVRNSIRDLTRIYKPKDPDRFVRDFVRKYNIQRGFEAELKQIVANELSKI